MPSPELPLSFDTADVLQRIDPMPDTELDRLPFGVIAFDTFTAIRRYNAPESNFSGLRPEQVIGRQVFTEIAQCMNNFMVAQHFDDAASEGKDLDLSIDYVLTWRMRPTKVRLRLLRSPRILLSYLLLRHH